ncbi:MAG: hypothetical protein EOO06_20010, partial [Chitinophagaceae bacterium]
MEGRLTKQADSAAGIVESKVSGEEVTTFYRTVLNRQHEPLTANGLPKYLTGFTDREITLASEVVDDFCSVEPFEHCCCRKCPRPYEGLSLFEFGGHHGVKIEDLKAVTKGGRNYMDWDGNQNTAKYISNALHLEKPKSVVRLVLMCYEFDSRSLSDSSFVIARDQACGKQSSGHCTLYPVTLIKSAELVDTVPRFYHIPELSQRGWRPHCIQLRAQAMPKEWAEHFDPSYWAACRALCLNLSRL